MRQSDTVLGQVVKKHAHHLRADPVNPYWAAVQYWFLIALAVLLSAVAVAVAAYWSFAVVTHFEGRGAIYVATLPVVAIFGLSRLVVSQSRRFATVAGKARLRNDRRPPIVYLRGFWADGSVAAPEAPIDPPLISLAWNWEPMPSGRSKTSCATSSGRQAL
jgi:hypothetical protein